MDSHSETVPNKKIKVEIRTDEDETNEASPDDIQNSFSLKNLLKNTSEELFKCSSCDKSFYNATTLRNHQKVHEEDKNPKFTVPKDPKYKRISEYDLALHHRFKRKISEVGKTTKKSSINKTHSSSKLSSNMLNCYNTSEELHTELIIKSEN